MKIFVHTLFLILTGYATIAQTFDKAKLDKYFDALDSNNKFMGSVALYKDGKSIYTRSVGFADVATRLKADAHTQYRVGSITKSFTAVLVMQAVEEKKITLSTTIEKYLPTIKNAGSITIEQMLRHRSGIHNLTSDFDYFSYYKTSQKPEQLVEIITKKGSDFAPDTKAAYSNSNYILLSVILSKLYNKPYADLLEEKIIRPLGLKDTHFGGTINTAANQAKSYHRDSAWTAEPETDMSVPLGAGGIASTPSDLVQFYKALFDGKLVNATTLSEMKKIVDGHGLGISGFPFYEKTSYGHTGSIDAFSSMGSYYPEEDLGYAITCNGTNYNNNDISIAVLSAYFNKPYEIPDFKSFSINEKDLNQYLGVYGTTELPIKITVTKNGSTLWAQASGQAGFPLTPVAKDKFRFDTAGVGIDFNPAEKKLVLKQGGREFTFVRKP